MNAIIINSSLKVAEALESAFDDNGWEEGAGCSASSDPGITICVTNLADFYGRRWLKIFKGGGDFYKNPSMWLFQYLHIDVRKFKKLKMGIEN